MPATADNNVDWFLAQAGRYPLLSKEEELILGRQVQKWMEIRSVTDPTPAQKRIARAGRRAYDRFYTGNLRLVVHVAKRFIERTTNLDFSDLIQDGCIGLSRAIELYDPTRGYKFSTYAYWWIRQAVNRGIQEADRAIRLPFHVTDMMPRLRRWMSEFYVLNGRAPSVEECCEEFGIKTAETMRGYLLHMPVTRSLNATARSEDADSSELIDLIGDYEDTSEEEHENALEVERMLDCLEQIDDQDALKALASIYGLNKDREPATRAKTAMAMGVSKEKVRQMEIKTLARLRQLMEAA